MKFTALLPALALLSALAAPAVAGPLSTSPMWTMMGLDKASKVTLLDAHGKEISEEAFANLMEKGSFSIEKTKRPDGSLIATVRMNDPAKTAKKTVAPVALKAGDQLTAFSLRDLNGKTMQSTDLRGAWSVLSFYFADCAPCVQEVPQLNALAKAHPEMHFAALTFDSKDEARQFVEQRHLDWPVLPDAKAYFKEIKVTSFPLLILTGPEGKVVALRSGLSNGQPAVLAWVDAEMKKAQ